MEEQPIANPIIQDENQVDSTAGSNTPPNVDLRTFDGLCLKETINNS